MILTFVEILFDSDYDFFELFSMFIDATVPYSVTLFKNYQ